MTKYPTKKVSFIAMKIVRKPTTVIFKTKDGRTVSFKATKIQNVPKKISFYAKRKRK